MVICIFFINSNYIRVKKLKPVCSSLWHFHGGLEPQSPEELTLNRLSYWKIPFTG